MVSQIPGHESGSPSFRDYYTPRAVVQTLSVLFGLRKSDWSTGRNWSGSNTTLAKSRCESVPTVFAAAWSGGKLSQHSCNQPGSTALMFPEQGHARHPPSPQVDFMPGIRGYFLNNRTTCMPAKRVATTAKQWRGAWHEGESQVSRAYSRACFR